MFETLIIVVILGVLSAIIGPSFIGMFNRNKVNDALAQVRGALQEAQRQAIRNSKGCTVKVPKGNDKTVSSNCFVSRNLKAININHNKDTDPWEITFDFKGRTNDVDSAGTMVISSPDDTSIEKKCIVVSQGLGIIRTGNYTGTGVSAANCTTSKHYKN